MPAQTDAFLIEDIEVFDVLNSPFRQRIMRQLVEPKSVKQLATALDVPVTRLYHHINRMTEVGVLEVVDERKVGAMIEKIYQTAATSYMPGPGLLHGDNDPADLARVAAGVVLDQARADAEAALRKHFASGEAMDELSGAIGRGHAVLGKKRAKELARRIEELLDEMKVDDEDDEAKEYALSVVFFPSESHS